MGRIAFFSFETDFPLNKTLHWHWLMGLVSAATHSNGKKNLIYYGLRTRERPLWLDILGSRLWEVSLYIFKPYACHFFLMPPPYKIKILFL